jgi:hypothetical protein
MIKAITSWILIGVGGVLGCVTAFTISVHLIRAASSRFSRPGFLPRSGVPDFMGMSIEFFGFKSKPFFTDTWAFLTGQLAIALLVLAVGLHLQHLHRQAVGEQRLKELGIKLPAEDAGPNERERGNAE